MHCRFKTADILTQCIATAAAIGAGALGLYAEPALTCLAPHHDFGAVKDRGEVVHAYTVKNTGTDDLIISKIHSSCSCVVSDHGERTIPPGQESEIEVRYLLKGLKGKQRKTIYLHTNDKSAPYYRLSFELDVRQEVNVRPDTVFIGQLSENYETVKRTVQVEADETGEVAVTGLETNDLSFCNVRLETITEKKKYRLNIELPAGVLLKTGIYKGNIVVLTEHPSYARIAIPVTAMMRKDILVTPQTLSMKQSAGAQTRHLVVRSTRKDEIESVAVTVPGTEEVRVERVTATQYLVRLANLKPTQRLHGKEFVISVKLKSGETEIVRVPVDITP